VALAICQAKKRRSFVKAVLKIKILNYSPALKTAGLGIIDQKTATETP